MEKDCFREALDVQAAAVFAKKFELKAFTLILSLYVNEISFKPPELHQALIIKACSQWTLKASGLPLTAAGLFYQ